MKMKWMIVLVVLIALVGVYFYYPSLLQGVASDEARLNVKYVNVPSYVPNDLTVQLWLDGSPVGSSFTVHLSTSHSLTFRATLSSGAIYAERTLMFVAPSVAGNYNALIDGTTGTLQVVVA